MVIYSKSDGSFPKAKELGLRDFYHDEEGKYVGTPDFIPLEYKGREQEYFAYLNRSRNGEEYVCTPPKYNEKQEYSVENETKIDNLSWGRNHYSARVYENQKYEAWLNNWN